MSKVSSRLLAIAFALGLPMVASAQAYEELVPPNGEGTAPIGIHNGIVTGSYVDTVTGKQRGFSFTRQTGYQTFDAPDAALTYAVGSDDFGKTSGWFYDTSGKVRGFIRDRNGAMTVFDAAPGTLIGTTVTGMNGVGTTTGDYRDNGDPFVTPHGWVRSPVGIIHQVRVPLSGMTYPWDINRNGAIAGFYGPSVVEPWKGFIRLTPGLYVTFSPPPGCAFSDGYKAYLNDRGDMAGTCVTGAFAVSGFIRKSNGAMLTVNYPGADGTFIDGIAGNGDVAGTYGTGLEVHGYIRTTAGVFTSFDFPGVGTNNTYVTNVDEQGNVVGYFYDEVGHQRAYIRYVEDN